MTQKLIYECDVCKEQCEAIVFRVIVNAIIIKGALNLESHACDLDCYINLLESLKSSIPNTIKEFEDQVVQNN